MPTRDGEPASDSTFSNAAPGTSDADILGGQSTRVIWGTNISIQDSISSFKNFLLNFSKKYRLRADNTSEAEILAMGDSINEKEYVNLLKDMRRMGLQGLNLDVRNLLAYPATVKLYSTLR